ncbi:hypothetical protein [Isoptericola aurantiacus]|uniref:hypothetical protein n=1 Tax=Isoptericola aurantiacus TaxID=3377839 RepID=UPI00383A69C8
MRTTAALPPLTVEPVELTATMPRQEDDQPTPEWDAMVAEHGNPLLAGPDLTEATR